MAYLPLNRQAVRRRFALLVAAFASAAVALAGLAAVASAEVSGGLNPAPAAAATATSAVESLPEAPASSVIPAERAEAPAPSPEPPPAEAPGAARVTGSARAIVSSVVDQPVTSAPDSPPVAESLAAAGRTAANIAGTASARTTSVVPAEAEPVATIVAATGREVPALAEGIRRDVSEKVAHVRQGTSEAIAPLAGRLPAGQAGSSLALLLNPSNSAIAGATAPAPGLLHPGGEPPLEGALFPEAGGFFSQWSPIASAGPVSEGPAPGEIGRAKTVGAGSERPVPQWIRPAASGGTGANAAAASTGPSGSAPVDVPLPAPAPPGAIAPGSGDAFFVPFVALLALLALVAPASMRRLREAPDFRAPTPFVCALERPG